MFAHILCAVLVSVSPLSFSVEERDTLAAMEESYSMASVEVVRQGTLRRIWFPMPEAMEMVPEATKDEFLATVDRHNSETKL